jgi:hypothetical protein
MPFLYGVTEFIWHSLASLNYTALHIGLIGRPFVSFPEKPLTIKNDTSVITCFSFYKILAGHNYLILISIKIDRLRRYYPYGLKAVGKIIQ